MMSADDKHTLAVYTEAELKDAVEKERKECTERCVQAYENIDGYWIDENNYVEQEDGTAKIRKAGIGWR